MIKGCIFVLRAQNKKHSSRVFFVLLLEGFEGRVLNDVPGARQTAPQLRPGVHEKERSEFSVCICRNGYYIISRRRYIIANGMNRIKKDRRRLSFLYKTNPCNKQLQGLRPSHSFWCRLAVLGIARKRCSLRP